MLEHDWLTCEDPEAMLASLFGEDAEGLPVPFAGGYLPPHGRRYLVTDRKLRLWAAACYTMRPPDTSPGRVAWSWVEWAENPSHHPTMTVEEAIHLWEGPDSGDPSQAVKADLLRDIVGNPFRRIEVKRTYLACHCPLNQGGAYATQQGELICCRCGTTARIAWAPGFTDEVIAMADLAYHNRGRDGTLDAARLAILSDALEEAGCTDGSILEHLRDQQKYIYHVCGCWALDLVLGKE